MRDLEFILEMAENSESLKPDGFDGNPDGYDEAIVGITDDGRLVYSQEKMIELCTIQGDLDEIDAIEWLEFNTFCAYVGSKTPIFINTGLKQNKTKKMNRFRYFWENIGFPIMVAILVLLWVGIIYAMFLDGVHTW
jgi:hypothetical protein